MKKFLLRFKPAFIAKTLAFILIFLVTVHLSYHLIMKIDFNEGIFNFDSEMNVPSIYSAFLLLITSLLLLIIGKTKIAKKQKNRFHWIFLGLVFVFLSLDELFELHEKTMDPVRDLFNASGFFYFSWIILYMFFLILLFILYFKFFIDLPKNTRIKFFLSAGLFVLGGIVFEAIGGRYIDIHGWEKDTVYFWITTVEEILEITGVSLFIYTLYEYLYLESNNIKKEK